MGRRLAWSIDQGDTRSEHEKDTAHPVNEIDGYELLTVIRRGPALSKIPALAVTGYTGEREKHRSRAAGFAKHVTKPFDVAMLVNLIATLAPSPSRAA
jgi:CheY-like chemotaxis protein